MSETCTLSKAEKKGWLFIYNNKLCFPGWKQVWAVLYRNPSPTLYIYSDRSECVLEGEAQSKLSLYNVKIQTKAKFPVWAKAFNIHRSKQHPFQLLSETYSQQNPVIFAASNYSERERWINAIVEAVNPSAFTAKKNHEPVTKYCIPNESVLFPVLSKSEILANSPSCMLLRENIASILSEEWMLPFSKKEISLLKRIQLSSFSFVDFDCLLESDYSKHEIEQLTSDDILKCYLTFLKSPSYSAKERIEKKLLLLTFVRKFKHYATKVGIEIFERHFSAPFQFNKVYKFGSSISVEFLCDYNSAECNSYEVMLGLYEGLRKQIAVLSNLANVVNEVSVDVFTAVEHNGFTLLVKLIIPSVSSGVVLDSDDSTCRNVCEKISLQKDNSIDVIAYELDGKVMSHIRYDVNSLSNAYVANYAEKHSLKNIMAELSGELSSVKLQKLSIPSVGLLFENTDSVHFKYFCSLRLFSFVCCSLLNQKFRHFFLQTGTLQNAAELVASFVNQITNDNFYQSILKPSIEEFQSQCKVSNNFAFLQGISFSSFDSLDKRHVAEAVLNSLGYFTEKNLQNIFPLASTDLVYAKKSDIFPFELFDFASSPSESLYFSLNSKFIPRKLTKDSVVSELFLEISQQPSFSSDQRLLLSCLATYFCSSSDKLLLCQCLCNYFHYSYSSHNQTLNASATLERIKTELASYFGFACLDTVAVYEMLADAVFSLSNYEFSLALYQECFAVCCKYLGRNHVKCIKLQEKIATCLMLRGQYENALVAFHECRQLLSISENSSDYSRILLSIAQCLHLKGDVNGALDYSDKGIVQLKRTLTMSSPNQQFVDALLFQGRICDGQFALVDSLTSIITPQVRYYLSQAEQSYERTIEYISQFQSSSSSLACSPQSSTLTAYSPTSSSAASNIAPLQPIIERLVRISMLLLDAPFKEYIMMIVRKVSSSTMQCTVDVKEREMFISECVKVFPSKLFSSLKSVPNEYEVKRERIFYVAYRISGLQ